MSQRMEFKPFHELFGTPPEQQQQQQQQQQQPGKAASPSITAPYPHSDIIFQGILYFYCLLCLGSLKI